MNTFWQHIQALAGDTLHTLDQGKPFEVLLVTDYACILAVPADNPARPKVRALYHADLAPLYQRLVQDHQLDIRTIKETFRFNSSYASALLAALPDVHATTRPIHLRLDSS